MDVCSVSSAIIQISMVYLFVFKLFGANVQDAEENVGCFYQHSFLV